MQSQRTSRQIAHIALLLFFVLAAGLPPAFAQVARAQISGRVVDETGAVLPGVTVTVRNEDTGVSRTLVTNEAGLYIAANLLPGPYEVRTELAGFRTDVRRNIQLSVGSEVSIGFQMAMGEFAEELAGAVVSSRLIKQLRVLDLSRGTLGDEGAKLLAGAKRSLQHLEVLDLSDNYLTSAGVKLVKGLAKKVIVDDQREPYDWDEDKRRYASVGE